MNRREFLLSSAAVLSGLPDSATGQTRRSEPDHAALLAQHDIVYLTPTSERSESMPIGNGDLVGMVIMAAGWAGTRRQ